MTKRYRYFLILTVLIVAAYWFARPRFETESPDQKNKVTIDSTKLEINGVKVVGLAPGREQQEIKNLKVSNTPSSAWEEGLERSLRVQGGESLKDITFKKVDSFVWATEGIALFVESVIVTVKNDQNNETTFKVLVDAQTGKILRNWDQPVFDPANPRNNFRIKLDSRYHPE